MAILNKKQKTKETTSTKSKEDKKVDKKAPVLSSGFSPKEILKSFRVTEKSVRASQSGKYTFNITPRANKFLIKEAVALVFGVTPIRVSITKASPKKKWNRKSSAWGTGKGVRKAVVTLQKGDKIDFV